MLFLDFTVCQDSLFQKVHMLHGREFLYLFSANVFSSKSEDSPIVSTTSKRKKKIVEMCVQ